MIHPRSLLIASLLTPLIACTGKGLCEEGTHDEDGVCVPDDMADGCCMGDGHCGDGMMCVNSDVNTLGVCKPLPPPAFPGTSCWSDAGCPEDETCEGAIVCPCGAMCIVADSAGMCTSGGTDTALPPPDHGFST